MIRMPAIADLAAGLLVLALGVGAIVIGRGYPWGSGPLIGPAVFPVGIGMLLIVFGLGILMEGALRRSGEDARVEINQRAFVAILTAVGAFAFLLERTGLVPATVVSVIIASLAEKRIRPIGVPLLAVALAILCVAIFIWGLNLPFRPIRW